MRTLILTEQQCTDLQDVFSLGATALQERRDSVAPGVDGCTEAEVDAIDRLINAAPELGILLLCATPPRSDAPRPAWVSAPEPHHPGCPMVAKLEIKRLRQQAGTTLLREVIAWHSDPESHDYNECEVNPCAWCERAKRLLVRQQRDSQK